MSTYNLKISQLERERDKWHIMYKHCLAFQLKEYNTNIRLIKELSAQLQRLQQRQKAQPKKKQKPAQ